MLETELERQTDSCTLSQSYSDFAQLEGAYIFPAAVRLPCQQDGLQDLHCRVQRSPNVARK